MKFFKGCSVFVLVWLVLVMVALEVGTCDGAKHDHTTKKSATPSGFKTVSVKGHGHKHGHHNHHHKNKNHRPTCTPTRKGHHSNVPPASTPSRLDKDMAPAPTLDNILSPPLDRQPNNHKGSQPDAATPTASHSSSGGKSHPSVTVQTVANPPLDTNQPTTQPTAQQPPDVSNSVSASPPPVSQNENSVPPPKKAVTSLPGTTVHSGHGPIIAVTLVAILGLLILGSGLRYAYETRKISKEKKYNEFMEFNGDAEFKF